MYATTERMTRRRALFPRSVAAPHAKKRRSEERRNTYWLGHQDSRACYASTLPLGLTPSGDSLKTAHWAVFLTRIHLIGSNPCLAYAYALTRQKLNQIQQLWLGHQDSNPE